MPATAKLCEEFRQLCREHLGVELSLDEASDGLARTLALLERFARRDAREPAAARPYEIDVQRPDP